MPIFSGNIHGHHKYCLLCDKVGLAAMHYLTRLWANCSDGRGDTWLGADAAYVEAVATWKGEPGELYGYLVALRWIDVLTDPAGVRIHGFWDANPGLLHLRKLSESRRKKSSREAHMKLTGDSHDSHMGHTGPSREAHLKPIRGSQSSVPPVPPSSVPSVLSKSFKQGVQGEALASKKNSLRSVRNRKTKIAPVPSHVRYAALAAEIKPLEAELEEEGHLSAEKQKRLTVLLAKRAEIRKQQIGE